jgi:hypothetical protein
VLQHLIVALGHDLGHALHVLTPCLHQATQILLRLREYVARAQSKVIGEAVTKVQKALTHRCQWAFRIKNPLTLGWLPVGFGSSSGSLGLVLACLRLYYIPLKTEC